MCGPRGSDIDGQGQERHHSLDGALQLVQTLTGKGEQPHHSIDGVLQLQESDVAGC